MKSLEKKIQMLMKNNHQLERKMEASKNRNEGLLVVVKKIHHEANLSKKKRPVACFSRTLGLVVLFQTNRRSSPRI